MDCHNKSLKAKAQKNEIKPLESWYLRFFLIILEMTEGGIHNDPFHDVNILKLCLFSGFEYYSLPTVLTVLKKSIIQYLGAFFKLLIFQVCVQIMSF